MNIAMVTLLWIVPLLMVLLFTRSAYCEVRMQSVTAPHVLDVYLGSAADVLTVDSPQRQQTINAIVNAIHATAASTGGGIVVLKPRDLTISFDMLPANLRAASNEPLQSQRTDYEQGVARMLREILRQARQTDSKLQLSVLGLPIEPSLGAASLAEKTNLRYTALMAEFTAFVSLRTVQGAQSLIGEAMAVRRTMPNMVRHAHGRAIYYQTDRGWRMATGVPTSDIVNAVEQPSSGIESAGVIASMSSGSAGGSSGGMDGMDGSSDGGGGGGGSGGGGGESGGGVLQGTSGVNHNNNSGGGTGGGGSGGGGSGGGGNGGGGGGSPPPDPDALRMYVTEEPYQSVQNTYSNYGAQNLITVYEAGALDINDDGFFDGIEVMRAYFDIHVPQNYTGPLCLDWEGRAYTWLISGIPAMRDLAIQQFLLAMNTARQLRPGAQVGIYGLPYNEYYERNQAWRDREYTFVPLYNASDCLFPSVYDNFKNGEWPGHTAERDHLYVKEVTEMALEMSQGKPVYPFMWTRWHTTSVQHDMELIPASEFKPHVAAIFTAQYGNDRADGVVWWGADLYYRAISLDNIQPGNPQYPFHIFLQNLFNQEIPPGDTDVEYFTRIHTATLRQLEEVIDAAPAN